MARTCSIDARPGLIGRTVSAQAARPHGLLGRSLGRLWVRETAATNDRAIELLDPRTGEDVLEIGCGPGRALAKIAERGARVTGVDPSEVMFAQALRRNRAAVNDGRVRVLLAESGTLPVVSPSFDAVLAIHTIYFWRDLAGGLREAHDVLRAGGRIVIGYRAAETGRPRRLDPAVYRIPTTGQLGDALVSAGFSETTVHQDGHVSIAVAQA
jgi:SAM-dependent methyltransferase